MEILKAIIQRDTKSKLGANRYVLTASGLGVGGVSIAGGAPASPSLSRRRG